MRTSCETSDACCERVVSSAMRGVQRFCHRSDVEAELSRATASELWQKSESPPAKQRVLARRSDSEVRYSTQQKFRFLCAPQARHHQAP
jgi:hypothetical protein